MMTPQQKAAEEQGFNPYANGNDMPHGWRPIEPSKVFNCAFFREVIRWTAYRQIRRSPSGALLPPEELAKYGGYIEARLFITGYDGLGHIEGTAIVRNFVTHSIEWYKFGCEHSWVEQGQQRRFEHNYVCKDCGAFRSVDSSG